MRGGCESDGICAGRLEGGVRAVVTECVEGVEYRLIFKI